MTYEDISLLISEWFNGRHLLECEESCPVGPMKEERAVLTLCARLLQEICGRENKDRLRNFYSPILLYV